MRYDQLAGDYAILRLVADGEFGRVRNAASVHAHSRCASMLHTAIFHAKQPSSELLILTIASPACDAPKEKGGLLPAWSAL
jgi:hypothetical protein